MIRLALAALLIMLTATTAEAEDLRRTGLCEASAAAVLPDGRLVVASDERDELAVYDRAGTVPVWSEDLGKVSDIEGAARLGDTIFWITSHGLTGKGKDKRKRRKLLATRLGGDGLPRERGKKFKGLRKLIERALAGHGLGDIRKALDIEGLAATPSGALLVALRAPLNSDGRALVVVLPDPFDRLELDGPSSIETEVSVFALDLGGRGIRGIVRDQAGTYVIIAGASGDEERASALYTWAGAGQPRQVADADFSGLQAEAVVVWEPGVAEILGDNARACKKKNGERPNPSERWFPSRTIHY